jgi:hypothetical protein
MNSAIFSTPSECYLVNSIIYAGPVFEIPAEKRKGEHTHSFKMITTIGPAYCNFNKIEPAKKARAILGIMIEQTKLSIFKTITETDIFDITKIVSFGKVLTFKKPENGYTHAFIVTLDTLNQKASQVWLSYKSENSARNVRKALYASIQSFYQHEAVPAAEEEQPDCLEITEKAM